MPPPAVHAQLIDTATIERLRADFALTFAEDLAAVDVQALRKDDVPA